MAARLARFATTALLALGALVRAAAAAPPPNLLLVTLDTTRADRLSSWGHAAARTPNLEALARRGTRFAACDTAAPITLPAHATILTGLYPPRHGVRDNGTFALEPRFETIAEALARAGYDTAAVVAAAVLARRHGLAQGFAVYDDDLADAERDAAAATDAALARLAELRSPFLLWVHYYDPHEEYRPPPRFAPAAADDERRYDGEIAYVDEQLGRLLAALPPDTTVLVVGDHGEMLGEHGEASHGLLLYAGARRVPLIGAGPGFAAGATIDCLVRTADVAPTLAAVAGVALPEGLDGQPLPAPGAACGRLAYAESFLPFLAYRWYPLRALSDGRTLYLQAPRPSLYRLDLDPGERNDLAPREPVLAELWRQRLVRALGDEPLEPTVESGGPLDAEQRAQLASLGYLGGAGGAVSSALADPRDRLELAAALHAAVREVQRGRCPEVLRELQRIVAAEPRNFPALTLAAECLRDLDRPAEAIALFRRAAAENPRSPVPPANLGALLLAQGQVEAGERELRRALALEPGEAVTAVRLAQLLAGRGEAPAALAVLEAALAGGARVAPLLVERGALRAAAGRLDEALADFREAARRDPADTAAHENLGRALHRLGRRDEAAAAYETLVRLEPGRADLWKTLGSLALERGDRQRAVAAFRTALPLEPDGEQRQALARLIAELGG